jgi:AraC family transcriptional regulator, transcriptional activator of pobA
MFNSYAIADFVRGVNPTIHFHINRLDKMPPRPPHIVCPHKHLFYELVLVLAGETIQVVDYQTYTLKKDTLFFISPGQLHFWHKSDTPSIRGYRLLFTEQFFIENGHDPSFLFKLVYLDNVYQNPYLDFSKQQDALIFDYFDLLYKEFHRAHSNTKALQSLLFLMLSEIQRLFEQQMNLPQTHYLVLFKTFIQLLEKHFAEKWMVSDYAKSLYITPRQLNRITQSIANQSVINIIQNRIILESKRLLTFSDLSVGAISEQLGFEDAAYFARSFRKSTDCSPSDFRIKMHDKCKL